MGSWGPGDNTNEYNTTGTRMGWQAVWGSNDDAFLNSSGSYSNSDGLAIFEQIYFYILMLFEIFDFFYRNRTRKINLHQNIRLPVFLDFQKLNHW